MLKSALKRFSSAVYLCPYCIQGRKELCVGHLCGALVWGDHTGELIECDRCDRIFPWQPNCETCGHDCLLCDDCCAAALAVKLRERQTMTDEDSLCFVCGKEPLHEDGQCPDCWAETQRLTANPPHTAEEKALAQLREVIDTLRARNRKLNWELANEVLHEKRLEQIWKHFAWMDELLESAAKI